MPWTVSVTIPACEPVNDTAGTPMSMRAMHSSAMLIRSPAVSSMSISRPAGRLDTSSARRISSSVRLAHGRDDDDHVVALAAGPGDVVGHGPDPVGVGHRGAAELLDDEGHQARGEVECVLVMA